MIIMKCYKYTVHLSRDDNHCTENVYMLPQLSFSGSVVATARKSPPSLEETGDILYAHISSQIKYVNNLYLK